MDRSDRTDLDIPSGTVWPATDEGAEGQPEPETATPVSLDPERDDAERNAASGGWEGANEQVENDFETEQLRRREDSA